MWSIKAIALAVPAALSLTAIAVGQSAPEEVVFDSDDLQLHGFLWRCIMRT